MFPERDRQDDCVGLECIPQRLGDDRGSNRPSLRCQPLGGPAARDGHVDVFTGEGVGQGLTYLSESYNCVTHNVSPSVYHALRAPNIEWSDRPGVARQICARPPPPATSLPAIKLLPRDARQAATAAISAGSDRRQSGFTAAQPLLAPGPGPSTPR